MLRRHTRTQLERATATNSLVQQPIILPAMRKEHLGPDDGHGCGQDACRQLLDDLIGLLRVLAHILMHHSIESITAHIKVSLGAINLEA